MDNCEYCKKYFNLNNNTNYTESYTDSENENESDYSCNNNENNKNINYSDIQNKKNNNKYFKIIDSIVKKIDSFDQLKCKSYTKYIENKSITHKYK